MVLRQPDLFHVFLQVPVPLLLFLCLLVLVLVVGLVVEFEEHRQEEVAVVVEGHVVVVRYVGLQCLFCTRPTMTEIKEIHRCLSSRPVPLVYTLDNDCCGIR